MDFTQHHTAGLRERYFNLLDSLSALRALAQIDLSKLTEEELIGKALNELVRYQALENCSVFVVERDELRCVTGINVQESHSLATGVSREPAERQTSMRFAIGEGVMGLAAQTGEIQYCRDCTQRNDFKHSEEFAGEMPGSLICVPISDGEKVIGVLNVSHSLPEYFELWQQHTVSLFATILGQMLHHHRLLHDMGYLVEQQTERLQQALAESERMGKEFERMSNVDGLTGLHNRRYFFSEAESLIARALRSGFGCGLILLDVDNFKRINDQYGHQVGDRVLVQIAGVLREEIRAGDILARIGGEEFVIMLPDTDAEGADQMAGRIQERLMNLDPPERGVGRVETTACFGISSLAPGQDDGLPAAALVDRLYSEADRAMYMGKRAGRNRRTIYTP